MIMSFLNSNTNVSNFKLLFSVHSISFFEVYYNTDTQQTLKIGVLELPFSKIRDVNPKNPFFQNSSFQNFNCVTQNVYSL